MILATRYWKRMAIPKRYYPDYISLDKLFRMYRAFLFQGPSADGKYYHFVQDPIIPTIWHGGKIDLFEDFVDVYVKHSKLYRLY
jgi:hypothetical protein